VRQCKECEPNRLHGSLLHCPPLFAVRVRPAQCMLPLSSALPSVPSRPVSPSTSRASCHWVLRAQGNSGGVGWHRCSPPLLLPPPLFPPSSVARGAGLSGVTREGQRPLPAPFPSCASAGRDTRERSIPNDCFPPFPCVPSVSLVVVCACVPVAWPSRRRAWPEGLTVVAGTTPHIGR
jgi:hypothetical protein